MKVWWFVAGCLSALLAVGPSTAARAQSASVYLRHESQKTPLAQRQAHVKRPIASLTKLMLALVAAQRLPQSGRWTAPKPLPATPGSQAGLRAGQSYTLGELLAGLLVASGNDAAWALERWLKQQGIAAVSAMNQKAAAMQLKNTLYGDVMGFGCPDCGSTAAEQWVVLKAAWGHPLLRPWLAQKGQATLAATTGRKFPWTLKGRLAMAPLPPHFLGGKSGQTRAAGQCLAGVYRGRGGLWLAVVLGGESLPGVVQWAGTQVPK